MNLNSVSVARKYVSCISKIGLLTKAMASSESGKFIINNRNRQTCSMT